MHEWMSECGHTPHIVVSAVDPGVDVPRQYVQDGRIILNVSYSATHNLNLGNDEVTFEARFSGTPFQVCVPMSAILGIYARETGQGMVFSDLDSAGEEEPAAAPATARVESDEAKPASEKRPDLRIIK